MKLFHYFFPMNFKIVMSILTLYPLPFPASVSSYSRFLPPTHKFRLANVTVGKVTLALFIYFTLRYLLTYLLTYSMLQSPS